MSQPTLLCDSEFNVKGVGNIARDVMAVLRRRFHERVAAATAQLSGIARQGGERRFIADREGGGEVTQQVHAESYHYWGQRLGYECWKDEQFCREYLRDNEYARVKSRNVKPTVGWVPGLEAATAYARRNKTVFLK